MCECVCGCVSSKLILHMNACVHLPKCMPTIKPIYSGYVSLSLEPGEHTNRYYQLSCVASEVIQKFKVASFYCQGCKEISV